MQLPLCVNCATSTAYCESCRGKLESGSVSILERDLAEKICAYSQRFPLSNACFTKAVDWGKSIVIFSEEPAALIGRKGALVRLLTRDFKKRVKIINPRAHPTTMIDQLLLPARSLGVNTVFKSGGGTQYKVRVPYHQRVLVPFDAESFSEVLKQAANVDAVMAFE